MVHKLSASNVKHLYAPAPMQESMLDSTLGPAGNQTYFRQVTYRIEGDLQPACVQAAFAELARRHDSLRTVFSRKKEDRWLQVVLHDWPGGFHYEDLRDRADRQDRAEAYKQLDHRRGFDCTRDPLSRVAVLQLADRQFELIWSYHHAVVDGWSAATLMQEYLALYNGFAHGGPVQLPQPPQYGAYLDWLHAQDRAASGRFWAQYLAGYARATGLPRTGRPGGPHPGFRKVRYTIPAGLVTQLGALAKRHQATYSVLLQAVWGILLSKLNNTRDVAFGLVVSGRSPGVEGVARMVGMFINTVPVRLRYDAGTTFAALLAALQTDALDREAHEYCPPGEIQAGSELRGHLYDHLLAFENFPTGAQLNAWSGDDGALAVTDSEHVGLTDYDFNVNVMPGPETRLSFDYNEQVYEAYVVEGLVEQFGYLLGQVVADETVRIDALSVVTPAERERLLAFNPAPRALGTCNTLAAAFAAAAGRFAAGTAVVAGAERLTYAQLDRASTQLARYLVRLGVQPQDYVAVMADRSVLTVVGLLAVGKAGAVYVPIDADLPAARADFMLTDTRAKVLLTDRPRTGLSAAVTQLHYAVARPLLEAEPTEPLPLRGRGDDLAYVIYTSGTTGTPKGVLIRQESIVDRVLYHNGCLPVTEADVVLQFASAGFDASLVEMLMALLAGGTLVIADNATKYNPALLLETLRAEGVTVAIFPPAYLQLLDGGSLGGLRKLISTGEAASLALSVNYAARLDFFNGYGPTETCVGATFHRVDARNAAAYTRQGGIPIGRPFANTAVYVVDDQLDLLPAGHAGEICVAGVGLAAGYLNQPEQTRRKFVPNPHAATPAEATLYRTGDLGRWNREGVLEYLGRRDEQVQVRGIRVEPAEVERVLAGHEAVKAALLDVRQAESGVQMVAYLVSEVPVSLAALRDFAARWLPTYMLPTHVVRLDAFPLTLNGKVDRQRLPAPAPAGDEPVEAPVGAAERQLAAIWETILDHTGIGRHANFFAIGGHSLKATRLIARIYRETGVKLALNDVFLHPTLAQMAALVAGTGATGYERIRPCPPRASYPLSHAQERVWLAHQYEDARLAYNVTAAYWLTGDLQPEALERALQRVVRRHEILRTNFVTEAGVPVQRVHPAEAIRFGLTRLDYGRGGGNGRAAALRLLDAQMHTPFDLENDLLLRATLVRTGPGEYLFVLLMHHIICDAWSKDVLARDLINAYNAAAGGPPVPAAALPVHYKDFAAWQQEQFSRAGNRDRAYWTAQLAGLGEPTALPADFPRPAVPTYAGAALLTPVAPDLARQLRQLARRAGTSLFAVGVAAVYALLHRHTGGEDLLVGTTVAGRDHDSLDEQIGFYINTLALRTAVLPGDSFESLLQRTKETTLAAFRHQHYPYDLLAPETGTKRKGSRRPLFDVLVELISVAGDADALPPMTGVAVEAQPLETHFSKHELAFRFFDNGDELALSLEYNTDLFTPGTAALFNGHILAILEAAVQAPAALLAGLPLGEPPAVALPALPDDSFNFNF